MNTTKLAEGLVQKTDSKIVFLVLDGVAGLPDPRTGKTELEEARTPNLDALCARGSMGMSYPVARGITPGSGPAHMSIFGYDPVEIEIGRGVLEALGIGMELADTDIAGRANFATLDSSSVITDRRAGRIPTEKNKELCARLTEAIKEIEGVEVIIRPGKEHRFVVVFRAEDLADGLTETDPQKTGKKPLPVEPTRPEAKRAAKVANEFVRRVNETLKGEKPANTCLLRGLAKKPSIRSVSERFKLTSGAIATYPMYRGLASLVGMKLLDVGPEISDEFETLKEAYGDHDYFFVHIKKTDSWGEDGNHEKKVKVIEEVDRHIPGLLELKPEVIAVTGDHSTPAVMKAHSWHPVPFLLVAETAFPDRLGHFDERIALKGSLGHFPALDALPMMLACAGKLAKYGA